MTDQEWLACVHPSPMLERLRGRVSDRKLRLFAVHCCFRILDLIPEGPPRECVYVSERFAEGLANLQELAAAINASMAACQNESGRRSRLGAFGPIYERDAIDALGRVHRTEAAGRWGVLLSAARARAHASWWKGPRSGSEEEAGAAIAAEIDAERARQADLLRDIVGGLRVPSVRDPGWLAWNAGTIPLLARAVFEEREMPGGYLDPVRLALLADLLEDAGCTDSRILEHLRGPGPHVRGCWVVDLLLGRE